MDDAPQTQAATRGISRAGWIVLVVGGFFLGSFFISAGFVASLVLRWPTSWDALLWAIPLLWAVAIALSALIMGKLLHVNGRRQWLVAFGLIVTVLFVVPVVVPALARFVQGL
jgi:hypothetical protein